ncbi:multicopper oxidase-like protein 1 [Elsinoe australis]|uniref:Multicopper oxidase-like protein 1 n=1 Tax=Elsinoe australis TaxID=40998 RepID=A0A4V6DUU1_9PEZI|nr:multicopper oxidase-like protein 1 [Elsinoe australis]
MVNLIRAAAALCCSIGFFKRSINCPQTEEANKVVRFEIQVSKGQVNPTGAGFRTAILTNGTMPGPTLRVNQGDTVEFLVHNYLDEETAVHFHGITQKKTPWADGTPGTSQPLIKQGASYLYRWEADEAGVYFYHSHNKGQIMDGLYGAIVIQAPQSSERPFHYVSYEPSDWIPMREAEKKVLPLMVSDWSQMTFKEFYDTEREANIDFTCVDAILINGAGSQYCLDRQSLDSFTNPLVVPVLKQAGYDGITDKGCVPPVQLFQGNYTLHLDNLPDTAYNKCIGGVGGKGNFTVDVHSGEKWAALTFINPGGLYPLRVTIDNHPLHIYAIDGQYTYPQTVDQVTVNNGNRISVFVKLDQPVGSYTIRVANDLLGQVLGGFGQLVYNGVKEPAPEPKPMMDYGGGSLSPLIRKFDQALARPYPPKPAGSKADRTRKFLIRKLGQPHGAYEWTLSGHKGFNHSQEKMDPPLLFQRPDLIEESELILKTKTGEWVDLIFEIEGPFAQAHPMHKHGNKAYIIGSGIGDFPWDTVEEAEKELPPGTFNWLDPPYRDSFDTLEGVGYNTWLALRYKVDQVGAWLLHCHVQSHLTGGMGITILDGVDEWPKVPEDYLEWNGFPKPQFAKVDESHHFGRLQKFISDDR